MANDKANGHLLHENKKLLVLNEGTPFMPASNLLYVIYIESE